MFQRQLHRSMLLLLAVLGLACALQAEQVKQLKPTGYVNDFAGVLDAGSAHLVGVRQISMARHRNDRDDFGGFMPRVLALTQNLPAK